MLITNFAAGELAETLFGRVDLGQYYSGVSHLENFDVIPTGGISRRHGMKRIELRDKDGQPITLGEGRIIPFILNRDESSLLFLSPKKVVGGTTTPAMLRIFNRYGAQQGEAIVSTETVPLYETMAEINEVQYAQNYDRMVLVHENYAPLIIREGGEKISINILSIGNRIAVQISSSDDVENPSEYDDKYQSYLKTPGNYPKAVTFFGGRIIFASTKNNPQRIFASKVNPDEEEPGVFNFATYKLFITAARDYITVQGELQVDSGIFVVADGVEIGKFIEPFDEYYVASFYFEKGTKIAGITGDTIYFTRSASSINVSPEQIAAFVVWKNQKEVNGGWSSEILIKEEAAGRGIDRYYIQYHIGNESDPNSRIGCFRIHFNGGPGLVAQDAWYYYSIADSDAQSVVTDKNALYNYVKEAIQISVSSESSFLQFLNAFFSYINDSMKYTIAVLGVECTYYGTPESIYQQLLGNNLSGTIDTYLSFYLIKLTEDRYPTADDGFTFEIASDMSDSIKWIAQNKNLLVGTETGEWVIPAGVNATNVQAVLNSRYGSDRIQATSVGDAMCFFQSGKKALVEYYIPQQDNNFRANSMAMLSKNMLHESPAFDFDFISAPYTKIFVSREDGTIVCLLYERNTGTFAWGRITTGKEIDVDGVRTRTGMIKSVATVPGLSGYDDVYLVVKRGEEFFLERHSERIRSVQDNEEAVFLDSYRRWDGSRAGYSDDALVYDETDNKVYPFTQEPIPDHVMWIGYPYESRVRSMPVLANDQMKQNNIKNLYVRFNDSFMPKVRGLSMEGGKERMGNTDTIGRPEPYSGVVQIPFPGVWDRDVFFELIHDKPTRCRILAVNAEAN